MNIEELFARNGEYTQEEIELKLYETFCRFFNMSPMEMMLKYGGRSDEVQEAE